MHIYIYVLYYITYMHIYIEDIYRYSHIIHGSQNGLKRSLLPLQCSAQASSIEVPGEISGEEREPVQVKDRRPRAPKGLWNLVGKKNTNLLINPKESKRYYDFLRFFLNPFWRQCFWTWGKGCVFESCGGLFLGAVGSSLLVNHSLWAKWVYPMTSSGSSGSCLNRQLPSLIWNNYFMVMQHCMILCDPLQYRYSRSFSQ